MDSHVFRLLALELAEFMRGGRVEKIHSPSPCLFALTVYNFGRKRVLTLRHDKGWNPSKRAVTSLGQVKEPPALYLTDKRLPNPEKPSTLVMTLRKYLMGRRLGAATIDWPERRISFFVPQAPGRELNNAPPLWFQLDLTYGPSLQSAPPEPAQPLWPNAALLAPDHRESLNTPAVWKNYPVLSPPLRKTLAELDGPEAAALLADLAHESEAGTGELFLYSFNGAPHLLSAWPLPPGVAADMQETVIRSDIGRASGEFPFLEAARQVYEPRVLAFLGLHLEKDRLQEESGSRRRLKRTLQKLEEEEKRLKALCSLRAQAVLLQASLWKYKADEKLDELTLNAEESPSGLEERIKLDPMKTLRENMAHMFKQSDRGARGLEILAERRRAIEAEMQNVLDGLAPLSAVSSRKDRQSGAGGQSQVKGKAEKEASQVQRFVSSDGFIILRGKSAKGNHALLKLAQPHDLWLHVEGGPSAHVVIRRQNLGVEIPERTLLEAGTLSGLKSWRKHDDRAEIISALVKDVRPVKGGAPGSVLVDKQQKSFMVTLDHELEEKLKAQ